MNNTHSKEADTGLMCEVFPKLNLISTPLIKITVFILKKVDSSFLTF